LTLKLSAFIQGTEFQQSMNLLVIINQLLEESLGHPEFITQTTPAGNQETGRCT
jgi:hypothetical protein